MAPKDFKVLREVAKDTLEPVAPARPARAPAAAPRRHALLLFLAAQRQRRRALTARARAGLGLHVL
jgi:hypothetical protein